MRIIILLSLLILSACAPPAVPLEKPIPQFDGVIVAMGDSLTAGLGLPQEDAYPAQLQEALINKSLSYKVINSGISGETSSGAKSRIDWMLKTNPDIVILEIGSNDGLRGIDLSLTKENIAFIIDELQSRDIIVVLAGMQMLQNLGPEYTTEFKEIFPALAEEKNIISMPFFLQDVAGEASLNREDQIHPNKEGYRIIVNNLLPYVMESIDIHLAQDN